MIEEEHMRSSRKGFTLVELAIVLVIIGIILGAVLKGQALIDNAKAKRLQNDMKALEAMAWTYFDRKGRMPGDCNSNGDIAFAVLNNTVGTVPSNNNNPTVDYCATPATGETVNVFFSDLRVAQIASYGQPNIQLAKNPFGGYFNAGVITIQDSGGVNRNYNVIAAYNVPAWAAKMIDVSIDGDENGTTGRVRNITSTDAGSDWPADNLNNQTVAVAYLFERAAN